MNTAKNQWWAKVVRKPGSSRLYVKLFYHGHYLEKTTGLKDTEPNRQEIQAVVDAMNRDLAAEAFIFEKVFPRASEAEKEFFAAKEGRTYSAPPSVVTFGQAYKIWKKDVFSQIQSDNTRTDYLKALKPHILPYFGDKTFEQITDKFVQNFFLSRFKYGDPDQGLVSKKRMNNIRIPLVRIWEYTVKERDWNIPYPFGNTYDFISSITSKKSFSFNFSSIRDKESLIKMRNREEEKEETIPRNRRVLLFSEYLKILYSIDPYFRPATEIAVLTGLIASEMAGIHIESRQNGVLNIAWSIRENKIRDFHKTPHRTRKFPLTNAINRAIDTAIAQNPKDSIFVFIGKRRSPFRNRAFRDAFCAACNKAGVDRAVPYALRHSFVAYSELLGVSRQRLIGLMGHANKDMIDRVYGKYVNFLEKDRQAIQEYFGEDYWGE